MFNQDFGFGGWEYEQLTYEPYQILGVSKVATQQQIRRAYKKLAIRMHPDKGGNQQQFQKYAQAFQILSNSEKRQMYDKHGYYEINNERYQTMFQPVCRCFERKTIVKKTKSKTVTINVTIQQIINGAFKKIVVNRYRKCLSCNGKGVKNVQQCMKCNGKQLIPKIKRLNNNIVTQVLQKCQQCQGEGTTIKQENICQYCKKQKVLLKETTLQVNIQPGCPDKHKFIFAGQSDQEIGMVAGDLQVHVNIQKDQVFNRKGADLIIKKQITILQALVGTNFELDHLDGKKYLIVISPGQIVSNKQIKTIKQLGLPFYKNQKKYGHLHVQFHILYPYKNQLASETIEKIRNCLGGYKLKQYNHQNIKIMQDFNEKLLNTNPSNQKYNDLQAPKTTGKTQP